MALAFALGLPEKAQNPNISCHFSPRNKDAVCGAKWEPSSAFSCTNLWRYVTCVGCLKHEPQYESRQVYP